MLLDDDFIFQERYIPGSRKKIGIRIFSIFFYLVFVTFLAISFSVLLVLVLPPSLKSLMYVLWGIYVLLMLYIFYLLICYLIEWVTERHLVYVVQMKSLEQIGQDYAAKIVFEIPFRKHQDTYVEGKTWQRKKDWLRDCLARGQKVAVVVGRYSNQIWDIQPIE